ncbi:MAG: hypothetical protein ABH804_02470 [archaeon]
MKENLIHIKLEYSEAVQSKKDVLSSEMSLLKIAKTIKRYRALRSEEIKMKSKLYKEIKETSMNLRKMQTILPKIEIPQIIKKNNSEEFEEKIKKTKEQNYDQSLEAQLREIQERLRTIQ